MRSTPAECSHFAQLGSRGGSGGSAASGAAGGCCWQACSRRLCTLCGWRCRGRRVAASQRHSRPEQLLAEKGSGLPCRCRCRCCLLPLILACVLRAPAAKLLLRRLQAGSRHIHSTATACAESKHLHRRRLSTLLLLLPLHQCLPGSWLLPRGCMAAAIGLPACSLIPLAILLLRCLQAGC